MAVVIQHIAEHQRRRTRALGAALAIALVAGPVVGWTLAQSSEPDVDTVTAAGGADSSSGGPSPAFVTEGWMAQGYANLGSELDPVSAR